METVNKILLETTKISLLVLIMMIAVDYINLKAKGKLHLLLKGGGKWKQYIVASALGALPGCLGSFAGVSLYMHGMLSFGALAGLMFATSGDEQFIMLALFPETALLLFIILFVLGILTGYLTDKMIEKLNIKTSKDCKIEQYHPGQKGFKHYFKYHIWEHIIKEHFIKLFVWTLGALTVIEIGLNYLDMKSLTSDYTLLWLILAGFIGLIPESGPHLVFVILFSKSLIPFSVLFVSSIVQDGHGMIPLLSFSVKDSVLIKVINLIFGLIFGIILLSMGF